MIIGHNLPAMIAEHNYKLNTDNKAKSSKKLASGYKINSAADNASGLAISEKMREQIRGLNRGTKNAQDGISWLQTGDGALNEVHDILHRMRELAVQSLNDTNTLQDKAALEMEFDSLQSEIDRITGTTQFNTKNIFSEHQPQYYQVEGNVHWQHNQKHAINIPDNSLTIKYALEEGGLTQEKTIEVPEGVYTTQELIDEIDDAMKRAGADTQGINLEFTKDGTCNLNLEGGVDIKGISGGLSYLLNDTYAGGSVGALIGTTVFREEDDVLEIKKDQNDSMFFQIMDFAGNIKDKSITIPPGGYTRQEIIDYLNSELIGTSVEAVKYSTGIKLQSDEAMITGFKGNMFKIDTDPSNIYTSVFYDNVMYGNTTASAASFTGGAVLTTVSKDTKYNKFTIDGTNNSLTIAANGGSAVTLTIPDGQYTASEMRTKLNDLFAANSLDITADYYTSGTFSGIKITSNLKGVASEVKIDSTSSAYNTLFKVSEYTSYGAAATLTNESTADYYPTFTGGKTFSGANVPLVVSAGVNDKFNINIAGTNYEITMSAKSYSSASDIVTELNNQLNGASALAGYKGKVNASVVSNKIVLTGAAGSGLTSISASASSGNTGYNDVFVGENSTSNVAKVSNSGTSTTPGKVVTNTDVLEPATISGSNTNFSVKIGGVNRTVTLTSGSRTKSQILAEINSQLKEEVTTVNNTFADINVNGKTNITKVNASGSGKSTVASKTYLAKGSSKKIEGEAGYEYSIGAKLTMDVALPASMAIDSTNNTFKISLNTDSVESNDNGKTETITLTNGTYTQEQLKNELQGKLNAAFGTGEGGVDVSLSGGKLVFTSRVSKSVMGNKTSIKFDTNTPFIKELKTTRTPAVATSSSNLASSIVLDGTNNTFNFTYNDPVTGTNNVSLNLTSGTYTATSIIGEINNKLNNAGIPVTASNSSGKLALTSNGKGAGYSISYNSDVGGTSNNTLFGNLVNDQTLSATALCAVQPSVTIDSSTNKFNIKVNGTNYSLTLDNGTYDRNGLVSMLNSKMSAANVPLTVSLSGNNLVYTDKVKGSAASIYMTYASGGSSMKQIYGETTTKKKGATASFEGDRLAITTNDNNTSVEVASNNNGSIFQTATITKTPINPTAKTGYISTKKATIDGVNISEPITIDAWNKELNFTYSHNGTNSSVAITVAEGSYTYAQMITELQSKLDGAVGAGELEVFADSNGVVIKATNAGSLYKMSGFSGGFYDKVLCSSTEKNVTKTVSNVAGKQNVEPAYTIGRKDIRNDKVEIEAGVNDEFTFDITYGGTMKTVSMQLDPGKYSGTKLVSELQDKINQQLVAQGLPAGMIEAGIGGVSTGVVGSNDSNALCLKLSKTVQLPYQGEYIIDGVRGDAAFFIFYQSDGKMVPSYVKGSKNINEAIEITDDNNELSFDVDGTSYSITIDNGTYKGQELLDQLNEKFANESIPINAKMDGKNLKLSYMKLGKHTIDNIGGSAKKYIFYQENKGDGKSQDIMLQLSGNAGDATGLLDARNVAIGRDYSVIDRPVLNTVTMGINSVTISQNKYAEKALGRIDKALDIVSAVRSGMGATQNRLEHAVAGNDNTSENTQAAESRLRDTEMASEMVDFSKHSILQQSAQAMIAQANSLNEGVLRLLQ